MSACEREDTDRKNVFKLVLPWRTFFLQASMPEIMEDWIRILDFKLVRRLARMKPHSRTVKWRSGNEATVEPFLKDTPEIRTILP